jgi:hypothetical protein
LVKLVKVVFMSKQKPSFQEASKSRFFLVRQEKVLCALLWLKEHNPLYKDVELDYEQLPQEGMIPEIYNCMTFCNRMKEDSKAHSRYDAPDSAGMSRSSFPTMLTKVDEDRSGGDEEGEGDKEDEKMGLGEFHWMGNAD